MSDRVEHPILLTPGELSLVSGGADEPGRGEFFGRYIGAGIFGAIGALAGGAGAAIGGAIGYDYGAAGGKAIDQDRRASPQMPMWDPGNGQRPIPMAYLH